MLEQLLSGQQGASAPLMQQIISQMTQGHGGDLNVGGAMAGDGLMAGLVQQLMQGQGQSQGQDPRIEMFRKIFGRDPTSDQELALLDTPGLSQLMR